MTFLPDQIIGRYTIIEHLGEDGNIDSYLASDTHLDRKIIIRAIIVENLPQSGIDQVIKRFDQEIKIAAKVVHQNIIVVEDFGNLNGIPYFVTENIPGETLETFLKRRGKIPCLDAVNMLLPIANALTYAHSKGVFHFNLKPANIMVSTSGIPSLLFFRVSKVFESETPQALTANLAAIDAPEYKAPEQITTKNADSRTDIYALGIIFYEMIAGRAPFQGDTPLAVLFKHVTESPPWLSQFIKEIPETLELILIKALEKKPEDRYSSMAEFAGILEQFKVDITTTPEKSLPIPPPLPNKATYAPEEKVPDVPQIEPESPTQSVPDAKPTSELEKPSQIPSQNVQNEGQIPEDVNPPSVPDQTIASAKPASEPVIPPKLPSQIAKDEQLAPEPEKTQPPLVQIVPLEKPQAEPEKPQPPLDQTVPPEKPKVEPEKPQPPFVQTVPVEKPKAEPEKPQPPFVQTVPLEKSKAEPEKSHVQDEPSEILTPELDKPLQQPVQVHPDMESLWANLALTGYSEVFLDAAKLDLYKVNAFRIMELPVDAKPRDLSKRQQMVDLAINTGLPVPPGSGRALPFQITSDSNAVREAMQRFRDPERRLVDEFFWFWPSHLNMSASDPALLALAQNDVDKARELWRRQENEQSEANISIHNLAILSHIIALELEETAALADLSAEQKKQRDVCWVQSLNRWKKLIEQENFWSRLTMRIRDLDDPRLTTGMARRMRASLPLALLIINARLALQAAEKRNLPDVERHLTLMKQSGFAQADIEEALRRVLSPVREMIRSLGRTAETDANLNPEKGDKIARSLYEQTRSRLEILDSIYPVGHPTRDSLHDDVAQQMLVCELLFVNKTEKWDECLETLKLILLVAIGQTIRTRVEDNIKIIQSNREYDLCWFCQKNKCQKDSSIEVKMHGDITRTPVYQYGRYVTQVEWKYKTILVPRCSSCKDAHKKADNMIGVGAVLGSLLGIVGCVVISANDSDQTCLGIVLLVVAGASGMGISALIGSARSPKGIRQKNKTNDFPLIKELLAKGWQMGEKPTNVQ